MASTSGQSRPVRLTARALILAGAFAVTVAFVGATPGRVVAPIRLVSEQTSNPAPGSFGVSGERDGLFPGRSGQMTLVLTNPNPFAIEIEQLQTNAASDVPGCPVENVSFGALAGHTIVPANGTATAPISVVMGSGATDACQGAVFRLTFAGMAGAAPGVAVPEDNDAANGSNVLGAVQQPRPPLVRTGFGSRRVAEVGAALVAAGFLLTALARRRSAAVR